MGMIPPDDPAAVAVVAAIQQGDVATLRRLLADNDGLVTAFIAGKRRSGRSLLHIATDWPGHFPNGVQTATVLIEAGADVNARYVGPQHSETPLHWTASNDDVAVLELLLDAGADIEARGGCIGDGTPLFDAVVFGQWDAARRLLERGATPGPFESAALGLLANVERRLAETPAPDVLERSELLWAACHGSQRAVAEYLLDHGADLNWVGWDDLTPLDVARRSNANALAAWLYHRGAKPAADSAG